MSIFSRYIPLFFIYIIKYDSRDPRLFVTYPHKLLVDFSMAAFVLVWLCLSFCVSSSDEESPFHWATHPAARYSMAFVVLVYLTIYKFGIHFVYFGSFNGRQHQLGPFYSRQRTELISRKGGERFRSRILSGRFPPPHFNFTNFLFYSGFEQKTQTTSTQCSLTEESEFCTALD